MRRLDLAWNSKTGRVVWFPAQLHRDGIVACRELEQSVFIRCTFTLLLPLSGPPVYHHQRILPLTAIHLSPSIESSSHSATHPPPQIRVSLRPAAPLSRWGTDAWFGSRYLAEAAALAVRSELSWTADKILKLGKASPLDINRINPPPIACTLAGFFSQSVFFRRACISYILPTPLRNHLSFYCDSFHPEILPAHITTSWV